MPADAAKFRDNDLIAVWGEQPRDPITQEWHGLDKAHILGRGYREGNRDRKAFSSVYNFYPLPRRIHSGGYRDHPHFTALLLEIAYEKVQEAIMYGRYEPTDADVAFLELRNEWFLKHFPPA